MTTHVGYVVPRNWRTLDEIIATNVRRIRKEEKEWSVTKLAAVLGVSRHHVYDLERPRPDRPQREFKWSDLVALCGAFETTLFDLVLPPEDVKVRDLKRFPGIISDEGDMRPLPPFRSVGRNGLSAHLFGVGDTLLSPEALKDFADRARVARANRDAVVQELASQYINEVMAIADEHLRASATETDEEE